MKPLRVYVKHKIWEEVSEKLLTKISFKEIYDDRAIFKELEEVKLLQNNIFLMVEDETKGK